MPNTNTLSDEKRAMEKKLHEILLQFERDTGLAVTSIQINRLDQGKVLPITSEALTSKVELLA